MEKIDAGPKGVTLAFHRDDFANPAGLIDFIQRQAGKVQLRPDHKLVYRRNWDDAAARVGGVRRFLEQLVKVIS